jgi:hypothetical protein
MTTRLERVVKRALRPITRPVLNSIDRRLTPLREEIDGLKHDVRTRLDAVASQNEAALEAGRRIDSRLDLVQTRDDGARHDAALGDFRERLEFTRLELMYEMRYGARGPQGATTQIPEPRIVTPDAIPTDGDVRLNLACGHIPLEGFVNVDGRELAHVDIVADVRRLPFEPGTVAQIRSSHLLEHFPVEELRRSLLPYWVSLLRQGGVMTAIVPDAEAMIAEFSAGRMSFEELRLVMFGQQEYDGDFHFNMFSRASLCELLQEAGLHDVRVVECARRNGVCYEMEIEGRRTAAEPAESRSGDDTRSRD